MGLSSRGITHFLPILQVMILPTATPMHHGGAAWGGDDISPVLPHSPAAHSLWLLRWQPRAQAHHIGWAVLLISEVFAE